MYKITSVFMYSPEMKIVLFQRAGPGLILSHSMDGLRQWWSC